MNLRTAESDVDLILDQLAQIAPACANTSH
jgi:hypothetical protein